jgi:hypothetical protein
MDENKGRVLQKSQRKFTKIYKADTAKSNRTDMERLIKGCILRPEYQIENSHLKGKKIYAATIGIS